MKQFYSIKEVAELLGVSQPTLRYWEEQFDNIRPHKSQGGTRRYDQKCIDEIRRVQHLLKEQKLSIANARIALKTKRDKIDSRLELLHRLESLRDRLNQLKDSLNEDC